MGIWEDIAKPVLGVGMGALGWAIAGPLGGMIGWGLGMGIGGALFPAEAERTLAQSSGPAQQLQPQANIGAVLPVVRGNRRIAGNLIWYEDIEEIVNNNESEFNAWKDTWWIPTYGGTTAPTNKYFARFAYGVCVGPAQTVRMYLGKNEYVLEIQGSIDTYNSYLAYRINEGTNVPTEYMNKSASDILAQVKAAGTTPLPISITEYHGPQSTASAEIVASKGASVPPYRNLHYITFANFPVGSLDAGVPSLTFEVNSLNNYTPEIDVTPQTITNMILTNEFVGLGLDPTTYLETTQTAAAATYATTNDLLLALVFDQQRSILDSLQYVIQHHNGFITYNNGQVAHRQMQIDDAAIAWAEVTSLSDNFGDAAIGAQWRAIT